MGGGPGRRARAGVARLLLASALLAAAPAARADEPLLLIVAGVGGSPEHRERFAGWAQAVCRAALRTPRPPRVEVLLERPGDHDDAGVCAPVAASRKEHIAARLDAGRAAAKLLVVLIGHGSRAPDARFNLPGPDLSPEDLAGMLDGSAGEVVVAHLGSASGAFVPALSAPRRVILTAASASEANETRFPGHFVAALTADGEGGGADWDADRNKDGLLSALEVFDFARGAVEREYEEAGLLRTEHPLLDDNGDGEGSREPETAPGKDGILAARTALFVLAAEADPDSDLPAEGGEELAALIAERDELAARVDALREARGGLDEETYLNELEELLLEIARLGERIAALREPGR